MGNPQWWMVGAGFLAGWIGRSRYIERHRAVRTAQGAFHLAVNAAVPRMAPPGGATGGMLADGNKSSAPQSQRTEERKD